MTPFDRLTSHMVPIERENVDTDAILPKQYMAMITRQGYGAYLFDSWRYREAGAPGQDNSHRTPYPDFPLNMLVYEGAQILLGGRNFGCGSSREHAVWAIQQHGIRALIASSFADIFYGNCIRNGVLPISSRRDQGCTVRPGQAAWPGGNHHRPGSPAGKRRQSTRSNHLLFRDRGAAQIFTLARAG